MSLTREDLKKIFDTILELEKRIEQLEDEDKANKEDIFQLQDWLSRTFLTYR